MVLPIQITRAWAHISTKPYTPFFLGFVDASPMAVPELVYSVEVEVNGKKALGSTSQFAMYQWFDKRSGASEEQFVKAIRQAAFDAVSTVKKDYSGKPYTPFATGFERAEMFRGKSKEYDIPPLGTQMVTALEEVAILDAVSRAQNINAVKYFVKNNCFDLQSTDNDLHGVSVSEIFKSRAPERLKFRHTVGLQDHIFDLDKKDASERSLEGIIKDYGVKQFKVKINNNIDRNIERLLKMSELFEKTIGENYVFTLDGNEAFNDWKILLDFVKRFNSEPKLANMVKKTKYLEQPFHRDLLKNIGDDGVAVIRELKDKYGLKILIDESGEEHDSFKDAIKKEIYGGGYKMCKGILKAMRDRSIAVVHNLRAGYEECFNSPEDLTVRGPTAFPAALAFFSRIKAFVKPEFNGVFNTMCKISTEEEKKQAERTMPGLYYIEKGELKLKLTGDSYPTKDITGIGLGGPEVCFDPIANVPHLRELIHCVD